MLKKDLQQKKVLVRTAESKRKLNESNSSIAVLTEQKKKMSFIVEYSNSPMPPIKMVSNNSQTGNNNGNVIEHCSEQRRQALKRRLRTNRMLMAMVGVFLWFVIIQILLSFLIFYGEVFL